MIRAIALASALAVVSIATASALAAPARTGTAAALTDLQLLGDGRVAWLDTVCVRYCEFYEYGLGYTHEVRFVTARSDGRARRFAPVRRAEIDSSASFYDTSIVASPQAVAIRSGTGSSVAGFGLSATTRIDVGPALGNLRSVFACRDSAAAPAFDLDGRTLVYADDCATDVLRLWIATPDGQRRILYEGAKDSFGGLAIRGDYVAARIKADVNVFDQKGNRLARISPDPGTSFERVALGADGSLALTSRAEGRPTGACDTRLSWASIAQPSLHPIPVTGCPSGLKLTGRTVHYTDHSGIHAVGFDGGDRLVVERGNVSPPEDDPYSPFDLPFDADASLLTYGLRACDGSALIRTIPASASAGHESSRCPARFVNRGRLRLVKRGIRVRLRCPRGCTGLLMVRLGRRDVRHSPDEGFRQSGGSRSYYIGLGARTRRLLRRRGSLRLVVSARVEQRSPALRRTVRVRQRVTVVR